MKGFKYEKYRYIFPPRPKNAIPKTSIEDYSSKRFIGQPKLNGSNCTIYTDGVSYKIMNRHNQRLTRFNLSDEEVLSLHRGKVGEWIAINGEYMNKSKRDENGYLFNHKFVIFDILVYEGKYLVGNSFQKRIELLDNLYGKESSDSNEHLYQIEENIFRVKSYIGDLEDIFSKLILTDMYEGLVIKRKTARLELSKTETNNHQSQVKARKPTRNYRF